MTLAMWSGTQAVVRTWVEAPLPLNVYRSRPFFRLTRYLSFIKWESSDIFQRLFSPPSEPKHCCLAGDCEVVVATRDLEWWQGRWGRGCLKKTPWVVLTDVTSSYPRTRPGKIRGLSELAH